MFLNKFLRRSQKTKWADYGRAYEICSLLSATAREQRLPSAAYADEIQTLMWQACPAVALQILGYPNSAGRWKIEKEAAYLEIELDCR